MINRVGWDKYYLMIAQTVATRATCPVINVGAVFVNPNTNSILSVGYNGAPRGATHCGEACENRLMGENSDKCRAVHAEANAIYTAALNGVSLNGSIAYTTLSPCLKCAQALIQVGVSEVYFLTASLYRDGVYLLMSVGIPAFPVALGDNV